MPIFTVEASGTQTATISTEHTLSTPTNNGAYELNVDANALVLGDILELRIYDKIDGTNYRQIWKASYGPVPPVCPGKASPPKPITVQGKFTLKQIAGTGRAFPWELRRA